MLNEKEYKTAKKMYTTSIVALILATIGVIWELVNVFFFNEACRDSTIILLLVLYFNAAVQFTNSRKTIKRYESEN